MWRKEVGVGGWEVGDWCLELLMYGVWCVVCGLWFVVCGLWFVVCGLWFVVYSFGFWGLGFRV